MRSESLATAFEEEEKDMVESSAKLHNDMKTDLEKVKGAAKKSTGKELKLQNLYLVSLDTSTGYLDSQFKDIEKIILLFIHLI